MARGVAANEAGDGAALRIQTLLPVARRGYGTVWIDCGELWTLPRVPQPPKARGGAAIAWHAHLDATESTKLDLRINWFLLGGPLPNCTALSDYTFMYCKFSRPALFSPGLLFA